MAAGLLLKPQQSSAAWDGESSARGSCPFGPEGDECRFQTITRDSKQSYTEAADNSTKRATASGPGAGVAVADMDSAYARSTVALAQGYRQYAALDLYDPERIQVIKRLKAEGPAWVSKYARGGSARKLSARKMYIAVDALQGHLASNGFAPFPPAKLRKLVADVDEAAELLQQGK